MLPLKEQLDRRILLEAPKFLDNCHSGQEAQDAVCHSVSPPPTLR